MDSTVEIDESLFLYDKLRDLCKKNVSYFTTDERNSSTVIANAFEQLFENIGTIKPLVKKLRSSCHLYDFDSSVPGNGYRSYVSVVDLFIAHCMKVCNQMTANRDSFFFRKSFYTKYVLVKLVLC